MMEITGRIRVKAGRSAQSQRRWLNVGLGSIVIAVLMGLVLDNYAILAMIVPFLFLLNIRLKASKKYIIKDTVIRVAGKGTLEISNCEYVRDQLCSVRYLLAPDRTAAGYRDGQLTIRCIADKVVFHDSRIIPKYQNRRTVIQLYVSEADAASICGYLLPQP